MSNEIAVRDVDSWAPMLPAVGDLASKIASTNFVPKALRGKPAETAACILTGREIGIGPMEALQKIHVVEGRPALSAELMRALVLRAGHEIRYPMLTDAKVTAEGRRAGSESWTSVTWTMADAQRIGVAGKDVWKKYPRTMLANRATSELCRLLFPDALGGVSYTPDEIEEEAAGPVSVTVTRTAAPKSTVQRAKAPEPVEPPLDDTPVEAEVVDTETGEIIEDAVVVDEPLPLGPPASAAQITKVSVLFNAHGIKDRAERLAFVASVIGREVESSKDLSKPEASALIDHLESTLAPLDEEPPLDGGA